MNAPRICHLWYWCTNQLSILIETGIYNSILIDVVKISQRIVKKYSSDFVVGVWNSNWAICILGMEIDQKHLTFFLNFWKMYGDLPLKIYKTTADVVIFRVWNERKLSLAENIRLCCLFDTDYVDRNVSIRMCEIKIRVFEWCFQNTIPKTNSYTLSNQPV